MRPAAGLLVPNGSWEPITILVNNAGIGSGGPGSLDTFDAAQTARMRAVNSHGVIHTVRAVAPLSTAHARGSAPASRSAMR